MEIGIDIEKVSRFVLSKDSSFITSNFTSGEIDYAYGRTKPELSLCGFFCVKEAIIKTLNKEEKVTMQDISIYHENSKPKCDVFFGGINKGGEFKISISHCEEYGVAQVVRIHGGN